MQSRDASLEDDAEVLAAFKSEALEHLDSLAEQLSLLFDDPAGSNAIAEALRRLHSMKGTAASLGVRGVADIAHACEEVLATARDNGRELSAEELSSLTCAVDRLRDLVLSDGSESDGPSNEWLVERLVSISGGSSPNPSLGDLLVSRGVVGQESVERALSQQAAGDTRRLGEILVGLGAVDSETLSRVLDDQGRVQDVTTVRVAVSVLDGLASIASELRNLSELGPSVGDEITMARMAALSYRLDSQISAICNQEISTIWPRLRLAVREAAETSGKLVQLLLEGGDAQVHAGTLQMVVDPLVHLVRNAIDHGIEHPARRRELGKPEAGQIRVMACSNDEGLVVSVSDDGSGIDVESLASSARRRGIPMPEDVVDLIFVRGLSTAATVTRTSGRGVGLDVVRTAARALGGEVHAATERGKGCRFVISLPTSSRRSCAQTR